MTRMIAGCRCDACGTVTAWDRHACRQCGHVGSSPVDIAAEGIVWAVTTVHRPATAADASSFTVALLSLDCGERIMVRLDGTAEIGDHIALTEDASIEAP